MQRRWKKNVAGDAGGRPPDLPLRGDGLRDLPGARLHEQGPQGAGRSAARRSSTRFDPCPKGWDYHPRYSHELGELGIKCGIFPLYEVIEGDVDLHLRLRARRAASRCAST